jgi:hypothetical protein
MTEKFDPNATPETDQYERDGNGKYWVPWSYLREMEKEMLLYKEQLRIAMHFLNNRREFFNACGASIADVTVKQIEQVGK